MRGDLTSKDSLVTGPEARIKALELGYGLIFDFTNTKVKISIGEAYFWFDNYDKISPQIRNIPTAHISNDQDYSFFEFVETTWVNKGARIKLFKDSTKALEWISNQL